MHLMKLVFRFCSERQGMLTVPGAPSGGSSIALLWEWALRKTVSLGLRIDGKGRNSCKHHCECVAVCVFVFQSCNHVIY